MKYVTGLLLVVVLGLSAYIAWERWDVVPTLPESVTVRERVKTVTQTVTKPGGETVVTQTTESISTPLRVNKLGFGVSTPWKGTKEPKTYEVNIYRRVFENTWLGLGITTDKEIKASLQIEF